ncbi:MAG: hypothetical protein ACOCRK_06205 [bacterium]
MSIKDKTEVSFVTREIAKHWILNKHYAGRMPSISFYFGLYYRGNLIGICTYGKPASHSLCKGICGAEYADLVLELNRLITIDNSPKNAESYFVSQTLSMLPKPKIIVSYADTSQNHHGYIYQATNFIYTGLSDKHVRWEIKGKDKHARHYFDKYGGVNKAKEILGDKLIRTQRPRKHRYVYFVGNKRFKKKMKNELNYEEKPYPKGDNKEYNTGGKIVNQSKLF